MSSRHALDLTLPATRFRAPAIIAAVWVLVAIVAAVQAVALVRLDGRADLVRSVLSRLSIIPLWALATPLILRSAQWLPVVDASRRPSLLAACGHAALGSLFIVASNLVIRVPILFGGVSNGGGLEAFGRSTLQGVAEYYPPALVVYGVIVAAAHLVARKPDVPRDAAAEPNDTETSGRADRAAEPMPEAYLTVRQWNRVHLVRLEEIDWVEAQDNYVVVHAASRAYKGRERISDVEVQLDPRRFVRIHRSTIVQLAKIREVQPLTHGDHAVILRDGTVLRVARSRRQALGEALGIDL